MVCENPNDGVDVKISNNSWGGGGFSQSLKDAIESSGILFVAAVSNEGTDNDTSPVYPSGYGTNYKTTPISDGPLNVIAVAATDRNDELASFSNYGSTSVDLAAPGASIMSTLTKNTYGPYSGTSMATPHVAETAALIQSNNPAMTVTQTKDRLLQSVDKKPNLADKMVSGGRLNAARALGVTPP